MRVNPKDPAYSSVLVAFSEFLELTGVGEERVTELIELGWLQPSGSATPSGEPQSRQTLLFRQVDVYKTRKVDRLCDDFEVPALAGAIIVDLLERIADLETRLKELERF